MLEVAYSEQASGSAPLLRMAVVKKVLYLNAQQVKVRSRQSENSASETILVESVACWEVPGRSRRTSVAMLKVACAL